MASCGKMASTLFEDGAPSASLDRRRARAAPTHPRAQPLASAWPKIGEDFPRSTSRCPPLRLALFDHEARHLYAVTRRSWSEKGPPTTPEPPAGGYPSWAPRSAAPQQIGDSPWPRHAPTCEGSAFYGQAAPPHDGFRPRRRRHLLGRAQPGQGELLTPPNLKRPSLLTYPPLKPSQRCFPRARTALAAPWPHWHSVPLPAPVPSRPSLCVRPVT